MIRVLLAHPSRLVCASLGYALHNEAGIHVVGYATTEEALHFSLPYSNIVLLGTELQDEIQRLIEEVRAANSQAKVLILGVEERVEEIIRYIESGAAGYILRNESVEDIILKLEAASQEKAIVSPALAAAVMDRLSHLANLKAPYADLETRKLLAELTYREREVLQLLCAGHTNREIAVQLVVACGTVKNHVHKILKKLKVKNRQQAASIFQMHFSMEV